TPPLLQADAEIPRHAPLTTFASRRGMTTNNAEGQVGTSLHRFASGSPVELLGREAGAGPCFAQDDGAVLVAGQWLAGEFRNGNPDTGQRGRGGGASPQR